MEKKPIAGTLALIAAVFIWGSAYHILRSVGQDVENKALGFLTWRFGMASLVLLAFAWPKRRTLAQLATIKQCLLLAVSLAAGYCLQFFALIHTKNSATSVAFITSLVGPLIIIGGILLGGEKATPFKVAAVALAAAGLYMLSFHKGISWAIEAQALALCATVFFSFYFILLARFAKSGGPPIVLTTGSMIAVAFITGTVGFFGGGASGLEEFRLPLTAKNVAALGFAAVVVTALGLALKNYGVANTSLALSGAIVLLEPVIVLSIGLFLGESLRPTQLIGSAIILASSGFLKFHSQTPKEKTQ